MPSMSLQITSAHNLADFKCDIMTLALVKGPVLGGGNIQMSTKMIKQASKLLKYLRKRVWYIGGSLKNDLKDSSFLPLTSISISAICFEVTFGHAMRFFVILGRLYIWASRFYSLYWEFHCTRTLYIGLLLHAFIITEFGQAGEHCPFYSEVNSLLNSLLNHPINTK